MTDCMIWTTMVRYTRRGARVSPCLCFMCACGSKGWCWRENIWCCIWSPESHLNLRGWRRENVRESTQNENPQHHIIMIDRYLNLKWALNKWWETFGETRHSSSEVIRLLSITILMSVLVCSPSHFLFVCLFVCTFLFLFYLLFVFYPTPLNCFFLLSNHRPQCRTESKGTDITFFCAWM